MVLKLYGTAGANGTTRIVALTLAEKQIPFEMVPISLAGENKTPEYLAIHPFGQVPAIDDDGFILYESRAICRYLAEKYQDQGTKLIPTELKAKARFEQAASLEFANFNPYAWTIYFEGLNKARRGVAKDEAAYDNAVAQLSNTLDVYEVILGKQKFLAGDEFTLADLFHIGFGVFLAPAGCDLMTTKGPNITRWWNEINARPSNVMLKGGATLTSNMFTPEALHA
ncbi:glutathione S-transferase [Mycena maculata]|uniref:glutathione transferase n=1 Tax=Mycena maculata TaxID=230809 RepID=A0AAD7J283_9AGAR|nr:glutathione S-transferase [Mycena maculata]